MVTNILTASGIAYRRSRFVGKQPPTYAVYMDDVTAAGSDGAEALVLRHDITIELYESKPNDAAEAAMEAAIEAAGFAWTKQDRYWLQTEQLYQVIYEFTYYTKRRTH